MCYLKNVVKFSWHSADPPWRRTILSTFFPQNITFFV